MKEYLNVGEISSLFGLNVQTMHYYERIGLFVPAARTESGHRKYAVDQIYRLSSIRYLRRMGYSIEEIREFLEERTPDETIRRLKEHSARLQQQVEELQRMNDAIERKIRYTEHKRENLDTDRIEIRWFPERWYIPIGSENQLFGEEEFYLFPTIAFYEKEGKRFGGYVDLGQARSEMCTTPSIRTDLHRQPGKPYRDLAPASPLRTECVLPLRKDAGFYELFQDPARKESFFRFLVDQGLVTPEQVGEKLERSLLGTFWAVSAYLDMNSGGRVSLEDYWKWVESVE